MSLDDAQHCCTPVHHLACLRLVMEDRLHAAAGGHPFRVHGHHHVHTKLLTSLQAYNTALSQAPYTGCREEGKVPKWSCTYWQLAAALLQNAAKQHAFP